MTPEISPQELASALNTGSPPRLLDVRRLEELEISRLDPCIHIPLDELADRMGELDADDDWVIVCRTGNRSAYATAFLLGHGFAHVRNLTSGINGWAREIDPTVQIY